MRRCCRAIRRPSRSRSPRSTRADNPVDQDLALECWQNNGCDTGSGGDLTVAYVEPFGENVYREMSKMEFILQALTYPEIGEIIYKSSNVFSSSPGDPLADFRSVDLTGRRRHRQLPGHRRSVPAGVQGGEGRGNPGRHVRVGLRDRPRRELLDRRRRGHLRARRGLRPADQRQRRVGQDRPHGRHAGQPALRVLAEVREARR